MTDSPGDLLRRSLGVLEDTADNANPPGKIYLAFSGGNDSTALLVAASQLDLPNPVIAVHVNHGVHADSSRWAKHCQSIARSLEIPCQVLEVNRSHLPVKPDEGAMRTARYLLLEQLLTPRDVLLTAHHLEDVAESVLLAALRGGSCHELAGISARRPLGLGMLIRPWLSVAKLQLADLLLTSKLTVVEDPSNFDPTVRRSFVRQRVLPLLRECWPDATPLLAATSVRQSQSAKALDELLDQHLAEGNPEVLSSDQLDRLSSSTQILLIQRWITRHNLPLPSGKHIEQLLQQRQRSRPDRQPRLPLSGASIRCYRRQLFLVRCDIENFAQDTKPYQLSLIHI